MDCKQTILQYFVDPAGKLYIKLYPPQRNRPAAYHGQQEKHNKRPYNDQQALTSIAKCDKAGLGLGLGLGSRISSRLGLGLGLVLGS